MVYVIRRAEPDDFQAVCEIHSGSRAVWGTMQIPFPSFAAWRKTMEDTPQDHVGLLALAEDLPVGYLHLGTRSNSPRRKHVGTLGMAVRDEWQGKGAGTALMEAATVLADNWLNLTRLELQVYIDNEPAIGLYRKFGFEIEGTLRKFAFREGRFVDVYTMARLHHSLAAE